MLINRLIQVQKRSKEKYTQPQKKIKRDLMENITKQMTDDLAHSLQEASNYTTDRLILNTIATKGNCTLEEANFFNGFVQKIIEEAAEDFVPESIPEPAPEAEAPPEAPLTLTDADGNVYTYTETEGLIPVISGAEGVQEAPEGVEAGGVPVQESTEVTEVEKPTEVVAEVTETVEVAEVALQESSSEVPETAVLLTESQQIVASLINKMRS